MSLHLGAVKDKPLLDDELAVVVGNEMTWLSIRSKIEPEMISGLVNWFSQEMRLLNSNTGYDDERVLRSLPERWWRRLFEAAALGNRRPAFHLALGSNVGSSLAQATSAIDVLDRVDRVVSLWQAIGEIPDRELGSALSRLLHLVLSLYWHQGPQAFSDTERDAMASRDAVLFWRSIAASKCRRHTLRGEL